MSLFPWSNPTANKIIHLLNSTVTPTQLRQIQGQIIVHSLHLDTHVFSSFLNACKSLNLLHFALHLFKQLEEPHVFICNNLIKYFSYLNWCENSIFIYSQMHRRGIASNNYTFPFILKSLSDFRLLPQGESVHTHIIKTGHARDLYVQNSLMDFYASCGVMAACMHMFDEMLYRDAVSWTTLICGYRIAGRLDEALITFERMQFAGIVPNHVTMVNVLAACAGAGSLDMGVWVHDYIERHGWELDVILGTSLIDMYGKCGKVETGLKVFDSMHHKNIFTWNSLIRGLASAKLGEEAVSCFFRMEGEGMKPDEVSLIGVLFACSHSGLVEIGRQIFHSLVNGKYGFPPGVKHYGCMVDLLGRAGLIDEARILVERLPFEPNQVIWGSLFAGCRAHGHLEMSEAAAKRLLELEPENGTYHILLCNLYAEMGRWSHVDKLRKMMKERGMRKDLGFSKYETEARAY